MEGPPFSSRLSKSNDQLAFIGSVSLETRKQIGLRTSLSLWTDYEYISSVPQMHYADTNHPTRFSDDDVFASRTMLRLNIGLGSHAALRRADKIAGRLTASAAPRFPPHGPPACAG